MESVPKEIIVRLQQRHDKKENWDKSTVIPLAAEIIVYDIDDSNPNVRYKIGDGKHSVTELPFADNIDIAADIKKIDAKATLAPIIGSAIIIQANNEGNTEIGISISSDSTNALTAVNGALFVPKAPEYSIKQIETADGDSATYRLTKGIGDDVEYIGDEIHIPEDRVLSSASLEVVEREGQPYPDAKVGDPYIKLVFSDINASHLYIPVKSLVDTYTAGDGIQITNNLIKVNLAAQTNGLVAVNGALQLKLATTEAAGAMSKEDKQLLDKLERVVTWLAFSND